MKVHPNLCGVLLAILVISAVGCKDTENETTSDTTSTPDTSTLEDVEVDTSVPPPACVPEQGAWEEEIASLVDERCGFCHGQEPDYGAPFTLLSYEGLITGAEGTRPVDRMVERLTAGTMPPLGQPTPPVEILDAIVSWASCGEKEVTDAPGIKSSAPVFQGPSEAPEGLAFFDLTAEDFPVGPNVLDLYQCFILQAPIDSDQFIRRIEPIIDESAVLHHIVLLRDVDKTEALGAEACFGMPAGSEYIYAWAPGTGAVQFDDGGMRIKAGEQFVLQTHYNNGLALDDIKDSSGLRIYYSEPEGKEYGMFAPGPLAFQVDPFSSATIEGSCTVAEEMELLACFPHMHEIGSGFEQHIVRKNGDIDQVIALDGWSFEMQLFYDTPMTLAEGDKIITTCEFENPNEKMVLSGLGTSDEMCFNFMYVTPPPPDRYCDEAVEEVFSYTPGECAPDPAAPETPMIDGQYVEGDPPEYGGGEIQDGFYVLKDYTVYLLPPGIPLGELDYEQSFIKTAGQMEIKDGTLTLDYGIQINVILIGLDFTLQETQYISTKGTYVPGEEASTIDFSSTCPNEEFERVFRYQAEGNTLIINTDDDTGPINISVETVFEKLETTGE